MKGTNGFNFTFVETNRLDEWLSCSSSHPVAAISFGKSLPNSLRSISCPILSIDLPQLTEPTRVEVWTSNRPVQMARRDQVCVAMNGDVAAALLSEEESAGVALETTTYQAYRRLLSTLKDLGYPYLWRAWNYFPSINGDDNGLERYQRFCMGRHQALVEALPDFPASLPAGTAIGTTSGPLQVYALAGTYPAKHLGNPRQVHAHEYPKTYGPLSPSFARATVTQIDGKALLFLAGTASVVGHATRHVGSAHFQTRETLKNIQTLLQHAQDSCDTGSFTDICSAIYKVYVRHERDLGEILRIVADTPLSLTQPIFLRGDLCRRDLLVEIEAVIPTGSAY